MANAPQFLAPDGVYRSQYIFTTDIASRFFTGSMSADTADMQVSIRNAGFTSNPDLIYFEGSSFIIPNPSAYPQGLRLLPGENIIRVKSVLTSGTVTDTGWVQANLSLDRDIKSSVLAPSGIFVERFDQRIKITVEGIDDPNVVGYNFYASISPGGGQVGYTQVNMAMVNTGDPVATYSSLGDLTIDALTAVNPDGSHKADPQYFRVTGTQVDSQGNVLQTDFDQLLNIPETTGQMKTTMVVQDVRNVNRFSFTHDRRSTGASSTYPAIPNSDYNSIADTDPLYYVVTAVYLIDNVEYESVMSSEVAAAPMVVTPAVAMLPTVSRQQIVRDTSLAIFRSHPEADIKPGSILRDTVIDPFSTEAERIRFILGFVQAAQTSATLLPIDDPGGTGESIPVAQSEYKIALKQAFFLRDNDSVQNMIDNMFDHLAARRGVVRGTGKRGQGEVTIFVATRPQTDITIPVGTIVTGGSMTFRTTSQATISTTGGLSFYSPTTGRYFTRAFIQAADTGSAGNVAPGQIRSISGVASGVQVLNEAATFGGTDIESNRDLATRADGVLSAVDSGTYRGLNQTAVDVPGVRQVNVVDAGHSLMMRDYDTTLGKHTGGKVDVWVRGDSFATVSDSFAFTFETVTGSPDNQFEPVGMVSNLRFRAVNSKLTDDNPIIEMLSYPALGYVFKNQTTGQVFDLTDAVIEAPDKVVLSPAYNDSTNLHYTDVYTGAYRYRTGSIYTFTRQPVTDIVSLVGEVSGTIPSSDYKLFKGSDPLDLGRSPEAGDYMQVIQSPGVEALTSIPSSTPVTVTDEHHVYLGNTEYLNSLGILPLTVHIWNIDKSVEYRGPYTPSALGDKDFTFVNQDGETPMGFRATATARFLDGDELLVTYDHDEVFTITYDTNALVGLTQQAIDNNRHITADVLVKDAMAVGVNIKATVVIDRNHVVTKVDGNVRTNLARLFGAMALGQPVRQSDIIGAIDGATGVSYVVSPLTQMCKSDNSQVVREFLLTLIEGTDYVAIDDWSSATVKTYLITQMLEAATIDGGGEINDSKAVFQGPIQMPLWSSPPDPYGNPIKSAAGTAFIIGSDGLYIPGIALDDTKRRVLITLGPDTKPEDAEYFVSYVIYGDDGVKNITPGPTEYLELGNLEFTYDEDTDFEALVRGRRVR
jgi:hypothetical protein